MMEIIMNMFYYRDDDTNPEQIDFKLKTKMICCLILTIKPYTVWLIDQFSVTWTCHRVVCTVTYHWVMCSMTHYQAMYNVTYHQVVRNVIYHQTMCNVIMSQAMCNMVVKTLGLVYAIIYVTLAWSPIDIYTRDTI